MPFGCLTVLGFFYTSPYMCFRVEAAARAGNSGPVVKGPYQSKAELLSNQTNSGTP
jgi:hypothetical protein